MDPDDCYAFGPMRFRYVLNALRDGVESITTEGSTEILWQPINGIWILVPSTDEVTGLLGHRAELQLPNERSVEATLTHLEPLPRRHGWPVTHRAVWQLHP